MTHGVFNIPKPVNEPIKSYAPGSVERESLKKKLAEMMATEIEVPLIIGGKEVRTGKLGEMRVPHDHGRLLGKYHMAGPEEVELAIEAAREAWAEWSALPW